ncbi:MAG: hypothetical protein J6R18_08125, partial [Kiritimatiellae bacterium]|nr:hypothetical protein [Kiritimatiellia bacterium]
SNLQASNAIINEILTTALTAGKITAAEALIASATIPALYTTTIKALGNSLDLSANESINLMVGGKATINYGEKPPVNGKVNELWVQASTDFLFRCTTDSAILPDFYIDDTGVLYYSYKDGEDVYALVLENDGCLYYDENAPFVISVGDDGTLIWWERIKDSEITAAQTAAEKALKAAGDNSVLILEQDTKIQQTQSQVTTTAQRVETVAKTASSAKEAADANADDIEDLESRVHTAEEKITPTAITNTVRTSTEYKADIESAHNAADDAKTSADHQFQVVYSELEQTTTKYEIELGKKVGKDELTTYMRYEDGTLELGRSDSRYTTQTSDNGFKVLQDGSEMASIEQNTVTAPVINAQRMFSVGNHGVRLSANGALIIF